MLRTIILILLTSAGLFAHSLVSFEANQASILSPKQKSIVSISAFTARGDLPKLKQAFAEGLTNGLTINEIKEELIHLSAYCGFPRSLNGIITFNAVLDERKASGTADPVGRTPMKPTDSKKFETGKKVLEALTGQAEKYPKQTGYAAFVPAIDTLLKEHLFNDIFTRGVISNQERELITIASLISLGGVDSQMQGHFGICLNLGITPAQLKEVIAMVETKIGTKEAEAGKKVLARVLESRK